MVVKARWQREGDACSLIAKWLEGLTPLLGGLEMSSREFH
jgi:error-prone DNA polymerase